MCELGIEPVCLLKLKIELNTQNLESQAPRIQYTALVTVGNHCLIYCPGAVSSRTLPQYRGAVSDRPAFYSKSDSVRTSSQHAQSRCAR